MTPSELPVWRSMLFVPVTAQRFVDGAARRGADAIILDLEDAVALSEKERARKLGGTLKMQTSATTGTEVTVSISFNAMEQQLEKMEKNELAMNGMDSYTR